VAAADLLFRADYQVYRRLSDGGEPKLATEPFLDTDL
jgi:hypothetical protein